MTHFSPKLSFEVDIPLPLEFYLNTAQDWATQRVDNGIDQRIDFYQGLGRVMSIHFPNKRTLNSFLKNSGDIELRPGLKKYWRIKDEEEGDE